MWRPSVRGIHPHAHSTESAAKTPPQPCKGIVAKCNGAGIGQVAIGKDVSVVKQLLPSKRIVGSMMKDPPRTRARIADIFPTPQGPGVLRQEFVVTPWISASWLVFSRAPSLLDLTESWSLAGTRLGAL